MTITLRRSIILLSAVALVGLQTTALAQTYNGHDCTDDCSGHRAGFEWAEDNALSSEYDCIGSSLSFEEGCKSYFENSDHRSEENDDGDLVPD